MSAVFASLLQLDYDLLHLISTVWVSAGLDEFFLLITDFHKNPLWSVPLLGVILIPLFLKNWRSTVLLLVSLTLVVAASDTICYRLIKKNVDRPRPQNNVELASVGVRVLGQASGPGFPSNHAGNCFAAAVVLASAFPRRRYLFYILAGIIGYSRIYLGVHYPSDVLAGALVGIFVGLLFTHILLPRVFRLISRA